MPTAKEATLGSDRQERHKARPELDSMDDVLGVLELVDRDAESDDEATAGVTPRWFP